ncbi:type II secretion system protein J [Patescibacteria group bacterium]
MKNIFYKKGLTLFEVIIAISVFVLVNVILTSSILYFYRSNAHSIEQAFAVSSARKGVEAMVRDIREASYSDEGSYPVISMNGNTFYFYSDVDRDNNIERIRFFLDGLFFKKGNTKSAGDPLTYEGQEEVISIISDNVRNTEQGIDIFEYYNSNGDEITEFENILDVAFVKVNLIVNVNPSRTPNEFTLRSSATMRNLKTNL